VRVVNISQFGNSLVIHFDTQGAQINAYTLASTLVAFADAAKAANTVINSGCDIEVVVEALGPGSFRAEVRALYSSTKNLLANQVILGVIIGVLGNYIYERTLSLDNKIAVEIHTDEVVIQRGNDRVVVPRAVYDATRRAEKSSVFVDSVNRTFQAVAADDKVAGIGLVQSMHSPPPEIPITRAELKQLAIMKSEDQLIRIVKEDAELQIVKAILEKSKRKWEFVWRGIKISAPVTHEQFYVNFFAHHITIAPGDTLEVELAIQQIRDPATGIYSNSGYEVTYVNKHIPRIQQLSVGSDPNALPSNGKN
jgi:hypothetical protein